MKKTELNAKVLTTSVTQTANEILERGAVTLYYLIIKTPMGALTVNVGKKTHDEVQKLTNYDTEKYQDWDKNDKPVEKPVVNKK